MTAARTALLAQLPAVQAAEGAAVQALNTAIGINTAAQGAAAAALQLTVSPTPATGPIDPILLKVTSTRAAADLTLAAQTIAANALSAAQGATQALLQQIAVTP